MTQLTHSPCREDSKTETENSQTDLCQLRPNARFRRLIRILTPWDTKKTDTENFDKTRCSQCTGQCEEGGRDGDHRHENVVLKNCPLQRGLEG